MKQCGRWALPWYIGAWILFLVQNMLFPEASLASGTKTSLVVLISYFFCCSRYTVLRGYPWWWGLQWGILAPIGLVIIGLKSIYIQRVPIKESGSSPQTV